MPLTYDAGELELRTGDVVRVPLGNREQVAFVISEPSMREADRPLRALQILPGVPRAFDQTGLHLARFIAAEYICTLGEALSAVVLASAVPRTLDTFVVTVPQAHPSRYAFVPERLLSLIWTELREGFALEHLLRHPAARRAGDRSTLLRYVNALVRSGDLRRERRVVDPRVQDYVVRVLYPGTQPIRGRKAERLLQFVREQPGVPRADAVLAGFSAAVIARAIAGNAIREERVSPRKVRPRAEVAQAPYAATAEQRGAIHALCAALDLGRFDETLLFGVTGSGKTHVYIDVIKHALQSGKRAIVLVPEISLTPQTARRFEEAFGGRVVVLHSALSDRERFEAWQACARGEVEVVVGARSAVFAPLADVGIIVVDEAHEDSYKQDSVPRYHAVTVARERMRYQGGVLVLGSATPLLESYACAQAGTIGLLEMKQRATQAPLPLVRVVDMSEEFGTGNRRIFSTALAQALSERLARSEKAVLFVNRRGSAGFLLCRSCGYVPECTRCSVSLTVHRSEGLLRCHYCDLQRPIPQACEQCTGTHMREFGIGTQAVTQEVERLYPQARVIRMDGDTTTRVGDHARLLDEFDQTGDVLVGTQMVAKGLDFPTVTLVGVVAADIGLHAADFRAAERTFDVITQVCGRSGRVRPGEAIVQTYSPAHPAIVHAAQHDYPGFAGLELSERSQLVYPPACALMYVGVIGRDRSRTLAQAHRYAGILREDPGVQVLGPAPYPIARLGGDWRFRVALKATDLEPVRERIRAEILPRARADRDTRIALLVYP
ncbi:MAG TPA: primosomal protein N' [Candidatus Baltobacteraceae bacterium]|nr:primosomal protein N' [Candidatus Baltobacteraceae bacterium]